MNMIMTRHDRNQPSRIRPAILSQQNDAMKKVIIAFDGGHFSEAAFDFLCRINAQQPVLAVGVFLPAVDYAELLFSIGGIGGPIYYQDVALNNTTVIEKNIAHFTESCLKNGIEYRVHPDMQRHVIDEVKTESRYADLLIVGSDLFYENLGEDTQDEYLEKVLHHAECPVILVPANCQFPDSIVIAWDGKPASAFALRQFAYLFGHLANVKTTVVYVGNTMPPDTSLLEELAARHFSNLEVLHLQTDAKVYFNTWLSEQPNPMLITGAFGRSAMSEFVKKSFIGQTIHNYNIPIFVSHR